MFFQALDAEGLAVQTMRSLTYVRPGQTLSCVGCHESREAAPLPEPHPAAARASRRSWRSGRPAPGRCEYDRLVQPVLDRSCVSCHHPGSGNVKAARLDLTAAASYDSLLNFADKDLQNAGLRARPLAAGPGRGAAEQALVDADGPQPHEGVRLEP